MPTTIPDNCDEPAILVVFYLRDCMIPSKLAVRSWVDVSAVRRIAFGHQRHPPSCRLRRSISAIRGHHHARLPRHHRHRAPSQDVTTIMLTTIRDLATTTSRASSSPPKSNLVLRWIWQHRPPKRLVLGVAIGLPIVAVVQGAMLLADFRQRHADAPTPVTPSRGVVVAVHQEENGSNSSSTTTINKKNRGAAANSDMAKLVEDLMAQSASSNSATLLDKTSQEPPLRILVIGDSLAAGVGVSQSGSPVLPESIARTLSQRLGGRPVYWTCVGTPGASASRIVHDIESYHESLLVRQPTIPPELIVTESWIQGMQRQWRRIQARRDRLREWWEATTARQELVENNKKNVHHEHDNSNSIEDEAPPRPIVQWWRRVRERARSFREAWADPDAQEKEASVGNIPDGESSDTTEMVDPFQMWQRWRQQLQRRRSLRNPEIVGQFDVAIVLTGLNDLKEAFLPFMFRGKNASENKDYESKDRSLMSELERVLQALQQRMSLALDRNAPNQSTAQDKEVGYTLDNDDRNVEEELLQSIRDNEARIATRKNTTRRRPLVVFPALPVSPLPIFHSHPLRWFALPLFRRVDNYKREVANRFPGEVLFVETPSDDVFSQIEEGKGNLWDERRREQVLLRLTDITQRARDRVEGVMHQHYDKWKQTIGIKDESHRRYNTPTPEEAQHSCSSMEAYHRPGSSLISVDGIHPNDTGYEFWGRHIANAICKEWEAQDRRKATPEGQEDARKTED